MKQEVQNCNCNNVFFQYVNVNLYIPRTLSSDVFHSNTHTALVRKGVALIPDLSAVHDNHYISTGIILFSVGRPPTMERRSTGLKLTDPCDHSYVYYGGKPSQGPKRHILYFASSLLVLFTP